MNCDEKNLNIWIKDNTEYINCAVRNRPVVVNDEEKVRQAVLLYIKSLINLDLFYIKVEYKSMDIAIYKKSNIEGFNPYKKPSLIIEVKNNDIHIEYENENIDNQLIGYMNRESCNIGILINCNYCFKYTLDNIEPFDISNINELLTEENSLIEQYAECFERAKDGDWNSFLTLVRKFGANNVGDPGYIFKFTYENSDMEGYYLKITDNGNVSFEPKGRRYNRRNRKVVLSRNSYQRLCSLKFE